MRTFIAIQLENHVHQQIACMQENLKKADADVKWVKPSNIHITLRFLGDTKPKKIKAISESLPSFLEGISPFEIDITHLGAFPKIQRPRVLWAGIDKNAAQLMELAASIENGLCRLGFPKEERKFSGHITIGRVRSAKNITPLIEAVQGYQFPSGITQTIQHVIFFQSTLTSQGPIYEEIKKVVFEIPIL
ncbi:MAG: RNA 2',3'-cyclic phosphodiesterase [Candidatus Omnitrophica bacterium]|nr:RNA 2',3'-cyclic phosphodiesterase [Candidatus Omnitrophota bacterium]